MKNSILIALFFVTVGCTVSFASRKEKKNLNFTVDKQSVYLDGKLVALYQAKTYSLDNGELVEEYNLQYVGPLTNKQLIGDLIDFVSDRHQSAEVEIEINPENGQFSL